MSGYYLNGLLLCLFIGLQALQLIALPLWLVDHSQAWGCLLVIPVLLTNSWWAYIHEAIHGTLFKRKWANRCAGRLNAILFGSPFDLLRWGHLLHHGYNRTQRDRSEVFHEAQTPLFLINLSYYFRLLGGLFIFEVIGGILLLMPKKFLISFSHWLKSESSVVEQLSHKMLEAETLIAARLDAVFIACIYALAFCLYGSHGWMLVISLFARGLLVSLVDNAFHYGTPLEDRQYAHNVYLPRWRSALVLYFNLHGIHHLKPNLAWWELRDYHNAVGGGYQAEWDSAIIQQFKGPIPENRLLNSTA